MGQKVVGASVLLSMGESWVRAEPSNNVAWAGAYLRTMWHLDPSNLLATMHQHNRDRQNNGPVAYGEKTFK